MREQFKILFLLLATIIVIATYALIPQYVKVAGIELKKISLNLKPAIKNRPKSKAYYNKNKKHKNQIFLFIGDSMVEGLSKRFADYTGDNGHKLYTVIWYGSTTEKWAKTNTLEYFINRYKPSYIIICLGSNELFVNDLNEREQYVKKIITKIDKIPYLWISPAPWNGDTGIINIIKYNTPKSNFYDSRPLKLRRGLDHYHPTRNSAAYWMNEVIHFMMKQKENSEIKLFYPKKHHKATNTKLLQPAFEGYF